MKAVVATGINEYGVEDIQLASPKDEEIRVAVKAAGLCHSDFSVINGTVPAALPMVLGHEGAGVVTEVGSKVSKFSVGDHVVFSLQPVCGTCNACMRGDHINCDFTPPENLLMGLMPDGTHRHSRADGQDLTSFGALGCLAEETVVHQHFAVKIDQHLPFDRACLTSCGVLTGACGAINGGDIKPGDSVVVLGCGGVGLSAIQGARIAGAKTIVAVDIADNKLEMAREMGATHTVNGASENAVEKVHALTGGADITMECAGVPALMQQAFDMLRLGGTLLVLGLPSLDQQIGISTAMLVLTGRVVKGAKYGCNNPHQDIPMLLEYYQQGRLNLDSMVSKTYSIDQVHEAFEDMERNANARGVILI